ncbi:MAG: NAD(P)-dependent oxidoreductase [Candidatus Binatia bacterium]
MPVTYEDWRQTRKMYFSGEELAARVRELAADVLIVEADLVHEEVIDGVALRLIGAARGDPLNIGVERATAKKIPVLFAPARNAQAVAELTVGFMLSVLRRIHEVNHLIRSSELRFERSRDYLEAYRRFEGFELEAKTVGIVGFGAIGQRVARILGGFGSRILAHDPYATGESFAAFGAEKRDVDSLVRDCDVLTVHCPEGEETHRLISAERIRAMKPGAYVMNLARASIVDEDALYEGLASGRIAGAGLDVFSNEPVQPDNRFALLPNVVVMPHFGGDTAETVRRQSAMIVDGIEDWIEGRRPKHLVNPAVLA